MFRPRSNGSRSRRIPGPLTTCLAAVVFLSCASASEDRARYYSFDDRLTDYDGEHPEWFKTSFLDLDEDLAEALESGKSGMIVYFGQPNCAYCRAIMRENLTRPDLVEYLRRHFDVIGLSVFSNEDLTDIAGAATTVKEFAERERVHFTPALMFFGNDGSLALKLRGYYPPYKMRAALEFVADGHYRRESFRDYLEKADAPPAFEGELGEDALFAGPPYALDRRHVPAERPLLVIFEQPDCHACDVFHTEPLRQATVRERLRGYEIVQLNVWDDETPVLTPDGQRLTPKDWAVRLGLFYTPTLVFFDEHGAEVIRIDSVLQFYRLGGVLRYVAEKGYLEEPVFHRWARKHVTEEKEIFGERPEQVSLQSRSGAGPAR